ncbi:hypothetical protein K443DRAFT_628131 [Laccaria amethystina LaAM-08-1]|uniref:Uncharacterized protein n=1 Tax=Laccaria amethystina LaAM-08-1 TaxID=1095629 RepID=A0A0C9XLA4_9AGAR|nr:hypothetical protein K443DRAFT_628131 [Laccaria amethystina LaAM-08-1]
MDANSRRCISSVPQAERKSIAGGYTGMRSSPHMFSNLIPKVIECSVIIKIFELESLPSHLITSNMVLGFLKHIYKYFVPDELETSQPTIQSQGDLVPLYDEHGEVTGYILKPKTRLDEPTKQQLSAPAPVPPPVSLTTDTSESKWDGWPDGIFQLTSTTSKSIGQRGRMGVGVVMISQNLGWVERGDISNVWGSLSAITLTAS